MGNYFIIHGSLESPYDNWFPWLYKNITNKRRSAYVPFFPIDNKNQRFDTWSGVLKSYLDLNLINENTTIIAHDVGCVFVAKFLISNKIKIRKIIFVSGFNNYLAGGVNDTMFVDNLREVKNYCNQIVCLYSDDNILMPIRKLEEFANTVGDTTETLDNIGYPLDEVRNKTFNDILKYID